MTLWVRFLSGSFGIAIRIGKQGRIHLYEWKNAPCRTRARSHTTTVSPSNDATCRSSAPRKAQTVSLGSSTPPLKAALYQMVLHRPVEPARITGHIKYYFTCPLRAVSNYQALLTWPIGESKSQPGLPRLISLAIQENRPQQLQNAV